ncbi:hypothetical protein V5799_014700 [Amblyomma americanum]|uniref:C2H2-type domain-containing protein n=1 Tax=Amblyomma americanum TaxID=6943 RepID=A0AAQ4E295_AMBAM
MAYAEEGALDGGAIILIPQEDGQPVLLGEALMGGGSQLVLGQLQPLHIDGAPHQVATAPLVFAPVTTAEAALMAHAAPATTVMAQEQVQTLQQSPQPPQQHEQQLQQQMGSPSSPAPRPDTEGGSNLVMQRTATQTLKVRWLDELLANKIIRCPVRDCPMACAAITAMEKHYAQCPGVNGSGMDQCPYCEAQFLTHSSALHVHIVEEHPTRRSLMHSHIAEGRGRKTGPAGPRRKAQPASNQGGVGGPPPAKRYASRRSAASAATVTTATTAATSQATTTAMATATSGSSAGGGGTQWDWEQRRRTYSRSYGEPMGPTSELFRRGGQEEEDPLQLPRSVINRSEITMSNEELALDNFQLQEAVGAASGESGELDAEPEVGATPDTIRLQPLPPPRSSNKGWSPRRPLPRNRYRGDNVRTMQVIVKSAPGSEGAGALLRNPRVLQTLGDLAMNVATTGSSGGTVTLATSTTPTSPGPDDPMPEEPPSDQAVVAVHSATATDGRYLQVERALKPPSLKPAEVDRFFGRRKDSSCQTDDLPAPPQPPLPVRPELPVGTIAPPAILKRTRLLSPAVTKGPGKPLAVSIVCSSRASSSDEDDDSSPPSALRQTESVKEVPTMQQAVVTRPSPQPPVPQQPLSAQPMPQEPTMQQPALPQQQITPHQMVMVPDTQQKSPAEVEHPSTVETAASQSVVQQQIPVTQQPVTELPSKVQQSVAVAATAVPMLEQAAVVSSSQDSSPMQQVMVTTVPTSEGSQPAVAVPIQRLLEQSLLGLQPGQQLVLQQLPLQLAQQPGMAQQLVVPISQAMLLPTSTVQQAVGQSGSLQQQTAQVLTIQKTALPGVQQQQSMGASVPMTVQMSADQILAATSGQASAQAIQIAALQHPVMVQAVQSQQGVTEQLLVPLQVTEGQPLPVQQPLTGQVLLQALPSQQIQKPVVEQIVASQPAFNQSLPQPPLHVAQQPVAQQPVAQQPVAQQPEVQHLEAQHLEALQPEAQQPEALQPETQQPEALQPEALQPEALQPEAQHLEAQHLEAQHLKAQHLEAQQPEAQLPVVQQPETQQPVAAQAMVQQSSDQVLQVPESTVRPQTLQQLPSQSNIHVVGAQKATDQKMEIELPVLSVEKGPQVIGTREVMITQVQGQELMAHLEAQNDNTLATATHIPTQESLQENYTSLSEKHLLEQNAENRQFEVEGIAVQETKMQHPLPEKPANQELASCSVAEVVQTQSQQQELLPQSATQETKMTPPVPAVRGTLPENSVQPSQKLLEQQAELCQVEAETTAVPETERHETPKQPTSQKLLEQQAELCQVEAETTAVPETERHETPKQPTEEGRAEYSAEVALPQSQEQESLAKFHLAEVAEDDAKVPLAAPLLTLAQVPVLQSGLVTTPAGTLSASSPKGVPEQELREQIVPSTTGRTKDTSQQPVLGAHSKCDSHTIVSATNSKSGSGLVGNVPEVVPQHFAQQEAMEQDQCEKGSDIQEREEHNVQEIGQATGQESTADKVGMPLASTPKELTPPTFAQQGVKDQDLLRQNVGLEGGRQSCLQREVLPHQEVDPEGSGSVVDVDMPQVDVTVDQQDQVPEGFECEGDERREIQELQLHNVPQQEVPDQALGPQQEVPEQALGPQEQALGPQQEVPEQALGQGSGVQQPEEPTQPVEGMDFCHSDSQSHDVEDQSVVQFEGTCATYQKHMREEDSSTDQVVPQLDIAQDSVSIDTSETRDCMMRRTVEDVSASSESSGGSSECTLQQGGGARDVETRGQAEAVPLYRAQQDRGSEVIGLQPAGPLPNRGDLTSGKEHLVSEVGVVQLNNEALEETTNEPANATAPVIMQSSNEEITQQQLLPEGPVQQGVAKPGLLYGGPFGEGESASSEDNGSKQLSPAIDAQCPTAGNLGGTLPSSPTFSGAGVPVQEAEVPEPPCHEQGVEVAEAPQPSSFHHEAVEPDCKRPSLTEEQPVLTVVEESCLPDSPALDNGSDSATVKAYPCGIRSEELPVEPPILPGGAQILQQSIEDGNTFIVSSQQHPMHVLVPSLDAAVAPPVGVAPSDSACGGHAVCSSEGTYQPFGERTSKTLPIELGTLPGAPATELSTQKNEESEGAVNRPLGTAPCLLLSMPEGVPCHDKEKTVGLPSLLMHKEMDAHLQSTKVGQELQVVSLSEGAEHNGSSEEAGPCIAIPLRGPVTHGECRQSPEQAGREPSPASLQGSLEVKKPPDWCLQAAPGDAVPRKDEPSLSNEPVSPLAAEALKRIALDSCCTETLGDRENGQEEAMDVDDTPHGISKPAEVPLVVPPCVRDDGDIFMDDADSASSCEALHIVESVPEEDARSTGAALTDESQELADSEDHNAAGHFLVVSGGRRVAASTCAQIPVQLVVSDGAQQLKRLACNVTCRTVRQSQKSSSACPCDRPTVQFTVELKLGSKSPTMHPFTKRVVARPTARRQRPRRFQLRFRPSSLPQQRISPAISPHAPLPIAGGENLLEQISTIVLNSDGCKGTESQGPSDNLEKPGEDTTTVGGSTSQQPTGTDRRSCVPQEVQQLKDVAAQADSSGNVMTSSSGSGRVVGSENSSRAGLKSPKKEFCSDQDQEDSSQEQQPPQGRRGMLKGKPTKRKRESSPAGGASADPAEDPESSKSLPKRGTSRRRHVSGSDSLWDGASGDGPTQGPVQQREQGLHSGDAGQQKKQRRSRKSMPSEAAKGKEDSSMDHGSKQSSSGDPTSNSTDAVEGVGEVGAGDSSSSKEASSQRRSGRQRHSETNESSFTCSVCGKSYAIRKEASDHILHKHYNMARLNDERPLSEQEVRTALRQAAESLDQLTCWDCGVSFEAYMSFYLHRGRCSSSAMDGTSAEDKVIRAPLL